MVIKSEQIKKHYGWVIVFTGIVAMAVVYGTFINSLGLFVVPLMENFGYTSTAVSAIISFKAIGTILGANLSASVIKRKGPKVCMMCSAVILVAVAFALSRSEHLWQFYLCATIMGMAIAGTTLIPISVLINNWFADGKRNFPLSIAYMGSGIGGLILNPFLNSIIQSSGWEAAFMTIGILLLTIYVPIIGILTASTPEKIGALQSGQSEITQTKVIKGKTFAEAVKSKYFVATAITFGITFGIAGVLVFYIASYYISIGFSANKTAIVVGISVGCIAVGKIIIGLLGDKVSTTVSAKVGFFSLASVFVLLCLVPFNNYVLIPIVITYGVGIGSVTVLMPAITNYFFGDREFTRIMGILSMFAGIGNMTFTLLTGIIIDMTSSHQVAFIIWATLMMLAGILMTVMFKQFAKDDFSKSD